MKKSWCYLSVGEYKVKIDQEDYDRVSQHTWRVRRRDDSEKLAIVTSIRSASGVKTLSLPKFLMNPPKGKLVYPRRHMDGFDFRKENLIVCTVRERQQMLPKKRKDSSSIYRGVSYSKKKKRWRAGITVKGKSINLGDFKTEAEAAHAYNVASKKYFGERSYQNTIAKGKNRRL